MANDFFNAKEFDLKYPERAILMESIIWDGIGEAPKAKIRIPILMPMSEVDEIKETVSKQTSNENGKSFSSTVYSTNYILLNIPKHLYDTKELNNQKVYNLEKYTEFIIIFIGGSIDIEDIKIIGRT